MIEIKKKKFIIGLVLCIMLISLGSSVSASTYYVYLSTNEYKDSTDDDLFEYANDYVHYYAYNNSSSAHKVNVYTYASEGNWPIDGYGKKTSNRISPGASVNAKTRVNYNAYWYLQLNVEYLYKNCTANGYIKN